MFSVSSIRERRGLLLEEPRQPEECLRAPGAVSASPLDSRKARSATSRPWCASATPPTEVTASGLFVTGFSSVTR